MFAGVCCLVCCCMCSFVTRHVMKHASAAVCSVAETPFLVMEHCEQKRARKKMGSCEIPKLESIPTTEKEASGDAAHSESAGDTSLDSTTSTT